MTERFTKLTASFGLWCAQAGRALRRTYHDFDRNNYLIYAGALSFFFFLSVFPLLIFLSCILSYVPIPNLFGQILKIMSTVVPGDAMGVVRGVLHDVLSSSPELLSFSIFGAIFAASGGFSSLITILNIAYDVHEGRPYWKTRLLAYGLTLLTGAMTVIALIFIALGPGFGNWLAHRLHAGWLFAMIWPYIRWTAIAIFTVLSVETIYFLAPNVKQRFVSQVPGAVLAVSTWIVASWGLGWYLQHVGDFNQTFGTLGALVALMLWFYGTALALILGAEINSELLHAAGKRLSQKAARPVLTPQPVQDRERLRTSA
ncbi:MAG: YihY/virulence factor BrkB family protein [Terriglobales bacterium]